MTMDTIEFYIIINLSAPLPDSLSLPLTNLGLGTGFRRKKKVSSATATSAEGSTCSSRQFRHGQIQKHRCASRSSWLEESGMYGACLAFLGEFR